MALLETSELIEQIRKIAHSHGYALAVHGSLIRDIDLVAVPWEAKATSPVDLYLDLRKRLNLRAGRITPKPHGRVAFILIQAEAVQHGDDFTPPQVDLSVMPPRHEILCSNCRGPVTAKTLKSTE
jgi:hypothetical protein